MGQRICVAEDHPSPFCYQQELLTAEAALGNKQGTGNREEGVETTVCRHRMLTVNLAKRDPNEDIKGYILGYLGHV